MKKILCPVDFSEVSKNALRYAMKLAELWDTRIDLIHIYHLESKEAAAVPYHQVDELLEQRKQEVDRKYTVFLEDINTERIGLLHKAYGIFTGLEIADATRDGDYRFVVMGTHGEKNNLEKYLGSVTTDLMTRSYCPVMAVPGGATFQTIKNLAYAVAGDAFDVGKGTTTALEDLLEFASGTGAELHVVHVASPQSEGKAPELRVDDYPVKHATYAVVNDTSVLEGLDRYVRDNDIQVLAMYVPKRRLWERLFHRSHTRAMAFHTSIPLLVFHA